MPVPSQVSASLTGWRGKWAFLDTFKIALTDLTNQEVFMTETEDSIVEIILVDSNELLMALEVSFDDRSVKILGTLNAIGTELHDVVAKFLQDLGFEVKD
jgi:hypothetical protein